MIFFRRNKYIKLIKGLNAQIESVNERLRQLEGRYSQTQAILSSMAEGVIVVDRSAKILFINPAIEKIFNVFKKEVEGKFFLEVVRNNDISELINDVLNKGEGISKELTLVWPIQKTFQINASPVSDGCLVVIHDITQIRKLERIRSDFVANVSHELKTPLTSIKGFVETLLEGALEDKENCLNFLHIIQTHANRLDKIIDDLLSLSRLESQEVKSEIEEIKIKELTSDILSGFKSQLDKKSVKAENDLPNDLSIKAEKEKIRQVMVNLIDNAIKFNKENGSVKIFSEDLGSKIKILIEDSGIGIPSKDLPRIFERFYRADKARSRELGGTGLGLSIVKHAIEIHSGSVGVESIEGLGSKFWFTIPKGNLY